MAQFIGGLFGFCMLVKSLVSLSVRLRRKVTELGPCLRSVRNIPVPRSAAGNILSYPLRTLGPPCSRGFGDVAVSRRGQRSRRV